MGNVQAFSDDYKKGEVYPFFRMTLDTVLMPASQVY
jgi:hypothetical protein